MASYMEAFQGNALPPSYFDRIQNAPQVATCADSSGPMKGFNVNYTKLQKSYNDLRSEAGCLPDNLKYAKEIDGLQQEINLLVDQKATQKTKFDAYIGTVEILQNARGPFDTYMAELIKEEEDLKKEYIQLQQGIRAGRRRFLDSDPQGGVTSVLGLQTADDKILLAFWICFAVAIILVEIVLLKVYGGALQYLNLQQKVTIFIVVLAICMGIAQYFIRTYG
jgi:hypothetical protein